MARPYGRSAQDRRGVSASEFALLAPVLVMIMLSAFDVVTLLQTSMRLERAAWTGAQFALANASDMAAVRDKVIAAWPELSGADVPVPALRCECASTETACDLPCPVGLVQTITVRATRSLTPRLLRSLSLASGDAVVRLR